MRKIFLLSAYLLCSVFVRAVEIPFQKSEVKSIMRKVADWQIANPHPAPEHDDLNWPQGAAPIVGMQNGDKYAEIELEPAVARIEIEGLQARGTVIDAF